MNTGHWLLAALLGGLITASAIMHQNWALMVAAGLLTLGCLLGAIPDRVPGDDDSED